jgi:hypothetical protein
MKIPKELYNGIIIWIELVFISSMKALNLADLFYLRAEYFYLLCKQNVKSNYKEGKLSFLLMLSL